MSIKSNIYIIPSLYQATHELSLNVSLHLTALYLKVYKSTLVGPRGGVRYNLTLTLESEAPVLWTEQPGLRYSCLEQGIIFPMSL